MPYQNDRINGGKKVTDVAQLNSIPLSRKVALVSIMTALALVGSYVFIAIPNVELGSVVLFITGLVFGIEIGLATMLISAVIFSMINPWGAAVPIILLSQVIAWAIIVITGYLVSLNKTPERYKQLYLGVLGFLVTLIFDLITNLGYSIGFSIPYSIALATGLPYLVVHVISNTIIFSQGIPPIERIIRDNLSTSIWEQSIDTSLSLQDDEIEGEIITRRHLD